MEKESIDYYANKPIWLEFLQHKVSTNPHFCNMTSEHTVYFLMLMAFCGENSELLLALGIMILIK